MVYLEEWRTVGAGNEHEGAHLQAIIILSICQVLLPRSFPALPKNTAVILTKSKCSQGCKSVSSIGADVSPHPPGINSPECSANSL